MPTLIEFDILSGDFLPVGRAKATILGIETKRSLVTWAWVRHVGGAEQKIESNLIGRVAGAAVGGGVASLIAGPLATIGAAVVGSHVVGSTAHEEFNIVGTGGSIAIGRAAPGSMASMRALMEDAKLLLASEHRERILAEFARTSLAPAPEEETGLSSQIGKLIDDGLKMLPYFPGRTPK